jgi:hypothetical protein
MARLPSTGEAYPHRQHAIATELAQFDGTGPLALHVVPELALLLLFHPPQSPAVVAAPQLGTPVEYQAVGRLAPSCALRTISSLEHMCAFAEPHADAQMLLAAWYPVVALNWIFPVYVDGDPPQYGAAAS